MLPQRRHAALTMLRPFAVITSIAVGLAAVPLFAAPLAMNYQGRLTNTSGQAITTTQTIAFTFWNADAGVPGATQLGGGWSDTRQVCPDANGLLSVTIGSLPGNPIPSSVFTTDSLWLNLSIGGTNLVPRTRVTANAFAIRADYATSAGLATLASQADEATQALSVPASGNVDAAAVKTGIISDARIPVSIARTTDVNSLLSLYQKFRWEYVYTTASKQMQPNCGYLYISDFSGPGTFALPPSSALTAGDLLRIVSSEYYGWTLTQNPLQKVLLSNLGIPDYSQPWTSSGNTQAWHCVASSASGKRLIAGYDAGVVISSDCGLNWTQPASGAQYVYGVASSADGSRLVACANGNGHPQGYIYTSLDFGATWSSHATDASRDWQAIASSEDGKYLVACVAGAAGYIYVSSDYGATWTARGSDTNWIRVAISANGSRMFACRNGACYLYGSADYGVTWSALTDAPWGSWESVACSADGRQVVATAGGIYTSSDYGVSWNSHTFYHTGPTACAASSADGTRVFVGYSSGGLMYNSYDSGASWLTRSATAPSALACSADGKRLVCVQQASGPIFTYLSQPLDATTAGTEGYIRGPGHSTLELQYVGSDTFAVLSHEGGLDGH